MNEPTVDVGVARRPRLAMFVAVPAAVVLAAFVVLLATGKSASDRSGSKLVGAPAPPIVGVATDNQPVSLDNLRGQWVVVNFFASWCTPCIQEHPELLSFAQRHKAANDASIISIAYADSPTAAREFFAKRGGDWPVLVDKTSEIVVSYGVIKVPETYLVAPSGVIVAKLVGTLTANRVDDLIAKFSAR